MYRDSDDGATDFDEAFGNNPRSFASTALMDEPPAFALTAAEVDEAMEAEETRIAELEADVNERMTIDEALAELRRRFPGRTFALSTHAVRWTDLPANSTRDRFEIRDLGGENVCGASWREAIDAVSAQAPVAEVA